jgi:hypothetical protein
MKGRRAEMDVEKSSGLSPPFILLLYRQQLRSVMHKKISTVFILLVFSSFMLVSSRCGVVNQAQQMGNLVKCDFRIVNIQNLTLAGVNIQKVKSLNDLNLTDAARITAALAGSSLPMTFQLNLEGKNPNSSAAGMNKLDWMVFVDNYHMASGSVDKSFTIPPNNGTTIIPILISVDLKEVLQTKAMDDIANFAFNLAGVGNKPTRIMAKIQPTIMIGQTALTYPGYITISTSFSGIH